MAIFFSLQQPVIKDGTATCRSHAPAVFAGVWLVGSAVGLLSPGILLQLFSLVCITGLGFFSNKAWSGFSLLTQTILNGGATWTLEQGSETDKRDAIFKSIEGCTK